MRAVSTAFVLIVVFALLLNRTFAQQISNDIFFSLTLAGCAIVFLSVRPLREFPQAVGFGAALVGFELVALKITPTALPAFAILGLASLSLLTIRRIWSSAEGRQLLQDSVLPPLLFLLLGYFGSGPLELTGRLHPKTLDLFLYSFDGSLGVQLSCKVGELVWSSVHFRYALLAAYYALPLAIMFIYARQLVRDRDWALSAFLAFAIAGPLGVVFYNLIPACGPGYLLASKFPFEPLASAQLRHLPLEPLAVVGARNAFPSLHVAWGLLVCWYSEGLSGWAKLGCIFFFIATVFAALGLGEHYFVDVVVAFPFALMIQAVCSLSRSRSNIRPFTGLVTGLALMLGWVALLRWGVPVVWVSAVIPWLLIAGTIVTTSILQASLRRVSTRTVAVNRGAGKS